MGSSGPTVFQQLSEALKAANGATFTQEERNELVIGLRDALHQIETPWQQMQALIWEDVRTS